jgi:hypothetical protein
MNIAQTETPFIVEAKACSCKNNKRNISYSFIESSHSLCIDRREIILARIQTYQRLLKYAKEYEIDFSIIIKELSKLKLALDLIYF